MSDLIVGELKDLPLVLKTKEYAALLRVTDNTLNARWRRGDRDIAQPVNPSASHGYRFLKSEVIKKLRGR